MTRSAPRLSGFCWTSPEKVLSTVKTAPASLAMAAMAAMSLTRVVGLEGVSTWMTFVLGRTAARTAAGSVVSTSVSSTPKRFERCSTRNPWMPM